MSISVGILTVSDRVSQGKTIDKSSEALASLLNGYPNSLQKEANKENQDHPLVFRVVIKECVPDDLALIQNCIKVWSDKLKLGMILTTGGTGFGVRDITPEAVKPILDKESPGLTIAMMMNSLKITPLASLSRPITGVRGHSIIITLPGSTKGSTENLSSILPVLKHACELAQGDFKMEAEKMHAEMNSDYKNVTKDQEFLMPSSFSTTLPEKKLIQCNCHRSLSEERNMESENDKNSEQKSGRAIQVKSNLLGAPVSKRSRASQYPLETYSNAVTTILKHSCARKIVEMAVNENVSGYVIAEDIYALENVPSFKASIVDGYAIEASNGSGEYQVIGAVTTGNSVTSIAQYEDHSLTSKKKAIRITTGAPVPDKMDTVIMVENTSLLSTNGQGEEELMIHVHDDSFKSGNNIRPIGCDIAKDEFLFPKGTLLDDVGGSLGVLVSCGIEKLKVFGKPYVSLFSSGNEIIDLSQSSKTSSTQVYDTNRPCLINLLKKEQVSFSDLGIAPDNPDEIESTIQSALDKESDIIISTGGVSMGEHDYIKSVLEQRFQAKIEFGRVFLKPGKPTTFALIPRKHKPPSLFFGLPGNPVSTIVDPRPEFHRATLEPIFVVDEESNKSDSTTTTSLDEINSKKMRQEDLPKCIGFWASTTGNQRSSRLLSMNASQCLLEIPSSKELNDINVLKRGTIVSAILITTI